MAKPYQEAKSVLKSYLERKGYGQWVEKPPISDHFSMWGPPTDAMSHCDGMFSFLYFEIAC